MNPRASVITLTYAEFASLWIVLSVTLLSFAVEDPVLQGRIELVKGLAFVAVTSGLLFVLLRAFNGRIEPSPADPDQLLTRPRVVPIFIALALAVPLTGLAAYELHAGQTKRENFDNLEAIAHLKAGQIESRLAALDQLRRMLAPGPAPQPPLRIIQAGVGQSIRMVPVEEVLFLEAADKYVRVLTAGSEYLIRTPLKELLPQLDPREFWQVHRGTVVRAGAIQNVTRDEAGKLSLSLRGPKKRLAVSRPYAYQFKAM
jgi:DNA-binding LytR/AlgR family response regulator